MKTIGLILLSLLIHTSSLFSRDDAKGNILLSKDDFRTAFVNKLELSSAIDRHSIIIDASYLARSKSFRDNFGEPLNTLTTIKIDNINNVSEVIDEFITLYGSKLGSFLKDGSTIVIVIQEKEIRMDILAKMKTSTISLGPGDLIIFNDQGDLW